MAKNPVLSSATKHVDIADFFVRELVKNGIVSVSFVRTAFMVADVLTKALGPDKFFRFMGVIFGLIRNDDLSAVQVVQAFRDAPAHKPIRDSPSLGNGAEKDGQLFLAARKPIRDSPSFGHGAEKDGQTFESARKPIHM